MIPNLEWSAGEDEAKGSLCNIEGNMEGGGGSGQTVLGLAPSPLGGAFSSLQKRLELPA